MAKYLLILFMLFSLPSYANNTLVFIHGYLGDGSSWRPTGIIYALQHNGWQDSGHLFPNGPKLGTIRPSTTKNYIYTVTLPSEAPLTIQARWLDIYLRNLQQRHPDNSLILVGHSAGGVVARLVMVAGKIKVKGLISIASPHLGTDKAELGAAISDSPASMFTPMLGLGAINRSQGLY
ncbi:MAG: alpha/beta fold hydrolase, partial [Proteobacteria bacterium]|nr:alpha/beta fold hydrolase [Pseudomonadota bacterium]